MSPYEVLFILSFCCLPYILYVSGIWLYLVLLCVLHVCLQQIRKQRTNKIEANDQGVIISGCDTGFGHDLAMRLDDLGFTVFAGCLLPEGEGAMSLINKASRRLQIVPMNVGDDTCMHMALDYVKAKLPSQGLWGIVANAGINMFGDVELMTIELYHKVMNVNFYGTIRLVKAFLPYVRKTKGRVVVVSSTKGLFSFPCDSAYHATKHAIETTADSLRLEMIKFGVTVSIIEPGNFGGATRINQIDRHQEEITEMWKAASVDVKATYSPSYLPLRLQTRKASSHFTAPSIAPVVDAMVDALVNVTPKARYVVAGSNQLMDITAIVARFYKFAPTWLSDRFIVYWTGCDKFPEQSDKKEKMN